MRRLKSSPLQKNRLVAVSLEETAPPIWSKLEYLNPSGSIKDRVAQYILNKALQNGSLKKGETVIEASSGSTSIALALVCAERGLQFIAVMPEGVSPERIMIIEGFGGRIILTPREKGIWGALEKAKSEAAKFGYFMTNQFENPDNPEAHHYETGPEILSQIPGARVDAIVSGVGTGGTLLGLYRAFQEKNSRVVPVAAKPVMLEKIGSEIECCSFGSHIPGVVEGVSKLYKKELLPGLIEIEIEEKRAIETTRRLIRKGFPVGPSSGLNFAAALEAQKILGPSSIVVTVFPDRMERYFSTGLFDRKS
ncbi:MAG: cysteine synthase family protein [Deltaproteobacteria bacterium]|nr:cysteine synthase family protein [Deltaproteobacteria bacterium]